MDTFIYLQLLSDLWQEFDSFLLPQIFRTEFSLTNFLPMFNLWINQVVVFNKQNV